MHVLLTGASGLVGDYTLGYLLRHEHTVISLDVVPLKPATREKYPAAVGNHHVIDLTDYVQVEKIFDDYGPFDGVIHFAAIPTPLYDDPRKVHNNNVTSSYNILCTAMMKGVKRISQASSINATGMSYTREGTQEVDILPLTEKETFRGEDPYALSKQICEAQADSLCRLDSSLRIASLRFHLCGTDYDDCWPRARWQDLWNWTSYESCAESAVLGLTSAGWEGHEAFHICGDDIVWDGGVEPESRRTGSERVNTVSTIELLKYNWPRAKYDAEWWKDNPRRGTADNTKAKKLLGFVHRDIGLK